MSAVAPAGARAREHRSTGFVVDADVHNLVPGYAALGEHLPARWHQHIATYGSRTPHGLQRGRVYNSNATGGYRWDAIPPAGGYPGSDPEFMLAHHFEPNGIDYGMLIAFDPAQDQLDLELGGALCRAINDWQIAEWIERDDRFRASIVVPYEAADLSVAEIERLAGHPGFSQITFQCATLEPLGRRRYWPIYAAAQEAGLPVAVHFASYGPHQTSPAGWASFYIESHTLQSLRFQTHVTSLIFEGVFERFPDLQVVMVEGGVAWMASLLWRMDANYRRLRSEVPALSLTPSEYARRNLWFSTQPIEEPHDPRQLLETIEMTGLQDRILFASDYPHWDYDSPHTALPRVIDGELRRAILSGNARRLYGLPPAPEA